MKSGFMLGRFQPFHNEHKIFLNEIQENFEEISVGVYNTPVSLSNPFTFEERKRMIEYEFEVPVFKVEYTKNLVDFRRNIKNYVGNSIFCTRDLDRALVMRLLKFGTFYRTGRYISGSSIRNLILNKDDEYKKYISQFTADIVESQEFIDRVKNLNSVHSLTIPTNLRSRLTIF